MHKQPIANSGFAQRFVALLKSDMWGPFLVGVIVMAVELAYVGIKWFLTKSVPPGASVFALKYAACFGLLLVAWALHHFKKRAPLPYGILELAGGLILTVNAMNKASAAGPMSTERTAALLAGAYFIKRGIDSMAETRKKEVDQKRTIA